MAVTNLRPLSKLIIALSVLGALALTACEVELSTDTPGAMGKCEPTVAQFDDFYDNVFTPDIASNSACVNCHKVGGTAVAAYKFQDPNLGYTDAQKYDLYCYHKRYGTTVIDFPRSALHAERGTAITDDDIPNLITWVNQFLQ